MKRFKNNPVWIFILIFFACCFTYPQISFANAPQDVTLSYDAASQMLAVTITHKSPFPGFHYIKHVEIYKNGSLLSDNKYDKQPDQATFTYSYKVPAEAGEKLEAKASCSLYGSRVADLIAGK